MRRMLGNSLVRNRMAANLSHWCETRKPIPSFLRWLQDTSATALDLEGKKVAANMPTINEEPPPPKGREEEREQESGAQVLPVSVLMQQPSTNRVLGSRYSLVHRQSVSCCCLSALARSLSIFAAGSCRSWPRGLSPTIEASLLGPSRAILVSGTCYVPDLPYKRIQFFLPILWPCLCLRYPSGMS